jgi:hypothetical protein
MNPRFSIRNMTQAGSLNFMILTVCVAICLTAWLAIAKLQASENNMDHLDASFASFQNAAQAQRAYNLAFQAALQDPRVARAIARAKRSGDPRDIRRAKALFREKKEDYIEKISDMLRGGAILPSNWICILLSWDWGILNIWPNMTGILQNAPKSDLKLKLLRPETILGKLVEGMLPADPYQRAKVRASSRLKTGDMTTAVGAL